MRVAKNGKQSAKFSRPPAAQTGQGEGGGGAGEEEIRGERRARASARCDAAARGAPLLKGALPPERVEGAEKGLRGPRRGRGGENRGKGGGERRKCVVMIVAGARAPAQILVVDDERGWRALGKGRAKADEKGEGGGAKGSLGFLYKGKYAVSRLQGR